MDISWLGWIVDWLGLGFWVEIEVKVSQPGGKVQQWKWKWSECESKSTWWQGPAGSLVSFLSKHLFPSLQLPFPLYSPHLSGFLRTDDYLQNVHGLEEIFSLWIIHSDGWLGLWQDIWRKFCCFLGSFSSPRLLVSSWSTSEKTAATRRLTFFFSS